MESYIKALFSSSLPRRPERLLTKAKAYFRLNANKIDEEDNDHREAMFVFSSLCSWLHLSQHHEDEDGEVSVRQRLLQQTPEDFDRLCEEKQIPGYKLSCGQCNSFVSNIPS